VGTGGLVAMKVGWLALLSILRQFSEQKRFATLPLPFGYFSIMSKLYFFTWKKTNRNYHFHFRDRHVFVRLYAQYVRPHLEFTVPAWSPLQEGDKEVLEKVQKRAVRMISGLEGKTYKERLKEVGLLSLEERRHQADMVQTYKIVTGKDMVKSETWFQSETLTGRATRSTDDPLNVRPQACSCGKL
jgi:hypothetical protein